MYKARLVAKRYNHKEWLDYHETLSPVVKMVILKTSIELAASKGWNMYQINVNNTLLQGDLYEEVYIELPQGLRKKRRQNYAS